MSAEAADTGIDRASEAEFAERNDLADRVTEALVAAGFPVHRDVNRAPAVEQGTLVFVDPGDDSRGGVFVEWPTDPSLAPDVLGIARTREFSSPALRHFGAVTQQMYATLVAILGSSDPRASGPVAPMTA
ncbi:hypothetical protein [Streptomyces sp. NPDC060198]|uniref:hypothetical protein n=1 Tax=Streptomyces sp. NPDC060198 TaxID=3347070 RepID=UPI003648CEBD